MLACASLAHADPSAADKETARGLMNEGRADRDKGDLKGAVKAFAAADALMHVPTTGIELAKAQVAVGLLVEARDTALRVTRIPEKPNEPAPFKAARDAAAQLNEDLGTRIPSLTISVKNVPDGTTASVEVDGAAMPSELLGQPRKLNPGHHVITAKAGTADGKQEIDLAEKDSKEVAIELPAQAAATPETKPDETPPPEAPAESSGGNKLLIWGGFGLAGAGVIAGSITGLLAISKANSVKGSSACQNSGGTEVCNPSEDGDLSSGKTMATVSTVSFIVAGVGAAIGVTGFFVGGSSAPAAKPADAPAADQSAARIVPWIGLGSAGVSGTF
jgi:hypothetical protein